jgi:hypothetical protein
VVGRMHCMRSCYVTVRVLWACSVQVKLHCVGRCVLWGAAWGAVRGSGVKVGVAGAADGPAGAA